MNARLATCCLVLLAMLGLDGCISIGSGGDAPAMVQYRLADLSGSAPARRASPVVDSLLIQALPADALADTTSIAYSRQAHAFAFYQFSSWTERPVRVLPRLLQRRLESQGLVGAAGLLGEPIRSDWLLTLSVDTLHHDVSVAPGRARLALTVELIDRRNRKRLARQQFATDVTTTQDNAQAATAAMSQAAAQTLDAMLPWLESELRSATAAK